MSQYPIITSSSDSKVTQIINEVDSKNLNVIHYINVLPGEDVRLGHMIPIFKDKDPVEFAKACNDFNIDTPTADVFIKFSYDLFDDPRDYRTVIKFPKDSEAYPVPGKGKIVAIATVNPAGHTVSRTGGEAL